MVSNVKLFVNAFTDGIEGITVRPLRINSRKYPLRRLIPRVFRVVHQSIFENLTQTPSLPSPIRSRAGDSNLCELRK